MANRFSVHTLEAYQTSDSKLFLDYNKATAHQENLIGELLDDLLADDSRGNVTRNDRFSILMNMLQDPKLREKVSNLYQALQHSIEDESEN